MKIPYVLTCASLLAVAGGQQAMAATSPGDELVKASLRQAICQQDWPTAITLSSRLIASGNITPDYRQQLVDWRYRFSQYDASHTYFDQIPHCEGVSARLAVAKPPTSAPPPAVDLNQAKANLRQAICQQDWTWAVMAASQLMASDQITAAHRQQLVDWRYRFAEYAASDTEFGQIPHCEGVTTGTSQPYQDSLPLAGTYRSRISHGEVGTQSPKGPQPDAPCYVIYASGRTVDLTNLCQ